MPDPTLQQAMEEIKAILRKHDVAAVVLLSSPKHMEFLYGLTPTWSCAKLEPHPDGGEAIRIRSSRDEYVSEDAQRQCLEYTIGMFMGFFSLLKQAEDQMLNITALLGQHFDVEHTQAFEGFASRNCS